MRWILIVVALTLVAPTAWAQTLDESMTQCIGNDPNGKVSGCTAVIQGGQETGSELASVYTHRGMGYGALTRFDEAIADFNQAITIDPALAYAYLGRAIVYQTRGLNAQAIADTREALRIDPNSADAQQELKDLGATP
jgi:Tfp pilus assembly protein PilF